jgi:glutaredoxin-related protein
MHVEIYTRPGCGFCDAAKDLLKNTGIPYVENRLDVDFTRETLVERYSTAKTYPVIVVDGFYIGGFTELNKLVEERVRNSRKLLIGD